MRAGWIILALFLLAAFGAPGDRQPAQQTPSQQPTPALPAPEQPRLRERVDPNPTLAPEQVGALADITEFETGDFRVVCRPGGAAQTTIRVLGEAERIYTLPSMAAWRLELTFRLADTGFTRSALAPGECAMASAAIPISGDEIRFVRVIDSYRSRRTWIDTLDSVSFAEGVLRVRGIDNTFVQSAQSASVGPSGMTAGIYRLPAYGPFRLRVSRCDRRCGSLDPAHAFYIEQELGACGFGGVSCH